MPQRWNVGPIQENVLLTCRIMRKVNEPGKFRYSQVGKGQACQTKEFGHHTIKARDRWTILRRIKGSAVLFLKAIAILVRGETGLRDLISEAKIQINDGLSTGDVAVW